MKAVLDIIRDGSLDYHEKRGQLAMAAEGLIPPIVVGLAAQAAIDEGRICLLNEGNAPYRPRYILPDYAKLLNVGSEYLDLAPAGDLYEAVNALLIAYRYIPSITGFPVYLGQADELLEPFRGSVSEVEGRKLIEFFLVQIDRVLPDAFVHMNLGPRDTQVGRWILECEGRLKKAVPNLSLKLSLDTPEEFGQLAVSTALETGKPYFANHEALAGIHGEGYGIASCYNTLPIGGGSHTLVRMNLKQVASRSTSVDDFLGHQLPESIACLCEVINARARFVVETARFFEASFLAREGLISLDRFTSMAGVFGLHECVEQLTGGRHMGRHPEADELARRIVWESQRLVKSQEGIYCQGTGGRIGFHAQSGLADDTDATAGVRIKTGEEPHLFQQIRLQASLQQAFDTGVSDVYVFDEMAKGNVDGVLTILRGAMRVGMRIMAINTAQSDLVRISGYLVKRTDLEKIRQHQAVREGTAILGEESIRTTHVLDRLVRHCD